MTHSTPIRLAGPFDSPFDSLRSLRVRARCSGHAGSLRAEAIVYLLPGGREYLGWFSDADRWFEWPAVQYGWEQRRDATSSQVAPFDSRALAQGTLVELPSELARLSRTTGPLPSSTGLPVSLRLSGVRVEDVG